MAININTVNINRTVQGDMRTSNAANKANGEVAGAATQDAFKLTSEAQELGRIQQNLMDQPSSKSARVAELKQAIADGSYKVDAERLAKNMVNFEGELNKVFN